MARIRVFQQGDSTAVVITGRLTADDMGRLEHACAPALTARVPRLEIDLSRVTVIDATAAAVVGRMAVLGARITWCVEVNLHAGAEEPGGQAKSTISKSKE